MTRSLLRRTAGLAAAVMLSVVIAACGGDEGTTAPVVIIPTITAVAGADSQTAVVASALPQAIRVKVVDQDSEPLMGAAVSWTVTSGAGTVDSAVTFTDFDGVARVAWVLGSVAGTQTLTATLANGTSVAITAIAPAAALASLAVISDPFVSIPAGGTTGPIQVRAFDRFGNSVAGAPHTWSTNGGTLATASTTTSAGGIGQATLVTATTPRDYVVTVQFAGGFQSSVVVRGN